ncbi:heavy-metal-associated domain-containing protein [bacterium]|nr:heavy-metal-associated domain-containing protein [bacterium]
MKLLLPFLILIGIVSTQDLQISLEVKGLSCPFCVFGLDKKLKKVPGVLKLQTSLKESLVEMKLRADTDLINLKRSVIKAGFTPGDIHLQAKGLIVKKDGQFFFSLIGSIQELFLLDENHLLDQFKSSLKNQIFQIKALFLVTKSQKRSLHLSSVKVYKESKDDVQ